MIELKGELIRGKELPLPDSWSLAKAWYGLKARYRQLRIHKSVTQLLGPQYSRSRERIEIDITYACNLRCLNCNRSVSQAPEKLHMSPDTIRDFVRQSITRNKRWKTIRVLGGEPTLHPQFLLIIDELLKYREWEPGCAIELVTNGNGKAVQAMLAKIPAAVRIENSAKTGNIQPAFGPFNLAPVDDAAFGAADYRNGCAIMEECGMGLTPLGYYPCAIAGSIDRISGDAIGYAKLPLDDDDMSAVSEKLCRLCGHFRDGHCVPENLRPALTEQVMSPTWMRLYDHHEQRKRALRRQA